MRNGKVHLVLLSVIVIVASWVRIVQLTEKNLW